MKRKQLFAVSILAIISIAVCIPMNGISALAAENVSAESTENVLVETEEPEQKETGIEEDETAANDKAAEEINDVEFGEETLAPDNEEETPAPDAGAETQIADNDEETRNAVEAEHDSEIEFEETIEKPEVIISEAVPEEAVQKDATEYMTDTTSAEKPLPASAKVTTTNVASGLKVRWEPVTGAREYVVYRGKTQIKRTSKTEITDTDVKYNNGTKYTYKVAAVSKTGKISTNTRSSTYYRLLPVGINSVKNTSLGKMTVTYGKNEKGSGYVVRFGLKSDMSDAKVITVKDPKTTSKVFSNLTKGKTYYVQVRSYKIDSDKRYYSGYCTTKSVKIVGAQKKLTQLESDQEYTTLDVTGDGIYDRIKVQRPEWSGSGRPSYMSFTIYLNGKNVYQYNVKDHGYLILQPTLITLDNGKEYLFVTSNDGNDNYDSSLNIVLQYKNGGFVNVFDFDKICKPHAWKWHVWPDSVNGNKINFRTRMVSYDSNGYYSGVVKMQLVYQDGALKENGSAAYVDEDYRTVDILKDVSAYTTPDQSRVAFKLKKGETVSVDQCRISSAKMLLRVKKGTQYGWILLGKGVVDLSW